MTMQIRGASPATTPLRVAEISLAALRHNVRALRHSGARVIVVVKANAYGHGAHLVAPEVIAAGAEMVAVASLDEALALRQHGSTAPILCWLHEPTFDAAAAIEHRIELGVSSPDQLRRIAAAALSSGRPATAQLKLDTGLSRNGASPESWRELATAAQHASHAGLVRITGVFSHLANASAEADLAQAARFEHGLAELAALGVRPPLRHLAASAAALSSPHLRYDAVRVGLAAYGLEPGPERSPGGIMLRPVMTLATELVAVRRERQPPLGIVPLGYADGLPRALGDRGITVRVRGERVPIIGQIGMDECAVALTGGAAAATPGDRVVLFGDPAVGHPAVEEWSEQLGTINYEIVARIGPRVQRRTIGP
ncbi:Alanine racemase [Leucobacter sp. 7(1)]|uniref:alanine racemase n=1 Tax=Leucobacter sp. 7(1) TaxID=1255613 RepID=UPI00097EC96F|nr:alanine racemase [Leucobacter sp. 7(1)]SJN08031.1 Alanine racemase [Leucobacter sp. 7(1)]